MTWPSDPRRDALLDQDWGAVWDTLQETKPLSGRPRKASQVTLRMAPSTVAGLRLVAKRKGLAYHALGRSYVLEGLRQETIPEHAYELRDQLAPATDQLNIKLEADDLDALKQFAHSARYPYHRLARHWIMAGLEFELAPGTSSHPTPPSLRDLMLLLLHSSPEGPGRDAVNGLTRLQKLLFVVEQRLFPEQTAFYAYNFGPFNPQVNDALEALKTRGILEGTAGSLSSAPTFDEVIAQAAGRAGPRPQNEVFRLNKRGHELAEQLRHSNDAYEHLFAHVAQVREEYDKDDLLERVYEENEPYTEHSVIKEKVQARRSLIKPTQP